MEIVRVKSMDEIKDCEYFYEMNGSFYGICWQCGKIFKVNYHRTESDIKHNTSPGDEDCFCSEECCDNFYTKIPEWKPEKK